MNKAERITFAGCFVLIVIHLVASGFLHQRLRGLNLPYRFFSTFEWTLLGAVFPVFLPPVNRKILHGPALVSHDRYPGIAYADWGDHAQALKHLQLI